MHRLTLTAAPPDAQPFQCRILCELEAIKGARLDVPAMLSGALKREFLAQFGLDAGQVANLWQTPWEALSEAQRSCVRKVNMTAAGWHCRLLPALTCVALLRLGGACRHLRGCMSRSMHVHSTRAGTAR